MQSARELALQALIRFRRSGAWPDLYLKQEGDAMPPEELSLATALTYGTLENMRLIDFYLAEFSSMPLKKISPQVLDALRLGVYQLAFMDKIPSRAAVHETVNLVKRHANPRAAGFANAVLRKLADQCESLPMPDRSDWTSYLAIQYSHPNWFVEKMRDRLSDSGAEQLLRANNAQPTAIARVNTLKISTNAMLAKLEEQGIPARRHPYLPCAVELLDLQSALRTTFLIQGLLYIQDPASQMAVSILEPQPGSVLYDLCAAPGGKTLLAAQLMQNRGRIIATDLHPHKVELLARNAKIYGADIVEARQNDASACDLLQESADFLICDVPCSGMGIIRKKPDIRYKEIDVVQELPTLQKKILENAARCLKRGGSMVYSTCTVLREENESVVESFLKENREFVLEPFTLPNGREVPDGMLTLYPHLDGTDGFFIAKIRRL